MTHMLAAAPNHNHKKKRPGKVSDALILASYAINMQKINALQEQVEGVKAFAHKPESECTSKQSYFDRIDSQRSGGRHFNPRILMWFSDSDCAGIFCE